MPSVSHSLCIFYCSFILLVLLLFLLSYLAHLLLFILFLSFSRNDTHNLTTFPCVELKKKNKYFSNFHFVRRSRIIEPFVMKLYCGAVSQFAKCHVATFSSFRLIILICLFSLPDFRSCKHVARADTFDFIAFCLSLS